jgi:hypothetical protein
MRRIIHRLYPLALLALLAGAFAFPATGVAAPREQERPVKVMTKNLYLGSSLLRAIGATTIPQFLAANAQIWSNVQQTDFPERAKALAREIADADPSLVGLQEAVRWYTGAFNDPAPATNLDYDFLTTLRSELAAIGAPYDLVRFQENFALEAPAGAPYFHDIRVVEQDAILVKAGPESQLTNEQSELYDAHVVITTGLGGSFAITPGWISVDAVINKRPFRFVNTHLEPFNPFIRAQQAQELVDGPVASAPGEVVLVGDINSGPEQSSPESLAFSVLTSAGLVDSWASLYPGDPGFTAAFSELLDDPSAEGVFDRRIDHVLTTTGVGLLKSRRTGVDPDNRTESGLWPSDHAGVVATLAP